MQALRKRISLCLVNIISMRPHVLRILHGLHLLLEQQLSTALDTSFSERVATAACQLFCILALPFDTSCHWFWGCLLGFFEIEHARFFQDRWFTNCHSTASRHQANDLATCLYGKLATKTRLTWPPGVVHEISIDWNRLCLLCLFCRQCPQASVWILQCKLVSFPSSSDLLLRMWRKNTVGIGGECKGKWIKRLVLTIPTRCCMKQGLRFMSEHEFRLRPFQVPSANVYLAAAGWFWRLGWINGATRNAWSYKAPQATHWMKLCLEVHGWKYVFWSMDLLQRNQSMCILAVIDLALGLYSSLLGSYLSRICNIF